MTTKTTILPPRNQGAFLGAIPARVLFDNSPTQGIVILWQRAIEVRGPNTRRVLPRSIVRNVHQIRGTRSPGLLLDTTAGLVQLEGPDLAHWGHRVRSWINQENIFQTREPVWGGGTVKRKHRTGTSTGVLCATNERVVFLPSDAETPPESLAWAELFGPSMDGATDRPQFEGPGIDNLRALQLAIHPTSTRAPTATSMTARVYTGWTRSPQVLAIRPEGIALMSTSRWGQWWSQSLPIAWDDICALQPAGPQAIRITLPDRTIRLESPNIHAILAELRRIRHAIGRARDLQAAAQGRSQSGWVVQYRTSRSETWTWAQLQRDGAELVVTPANARPIRHTIAHASWWPVTDRPLTMAIASDEQLLHIRPVTGHRLLPTWTRWLGPPTRLDEAPTTRSTDGPHAEHRQDTRIALALDTWMDPHGRMPDTAFERATHTIEISMSSVVVRCTSRLDVGQEVGLAIALGGPPIPTRARVTRQVRDDLWALVFVSPPAMLVHRIGSRVRAREREDQLLTRADYMPLTMSG